MAARWPSCRLTKSIGSRIGVSRVRSCALGCRQGRDPRPSYPPHRVPGPHARPCRRCDRAKDQLSWTFWLFLLAPDLFGLLPAALMGRAPARGYLPPRGIWLYNVWHTFTPPLLIGAVLALLVPFGSPWPLLGWLLHLSADRFLGFGLRGDDGGQAVF